MAETRERLTPEERATRQRRLMTLGQHLYGPSWQDRLSADLTRIAGRDVPRVRVNQWANGAKPLPSWMLPVLAETASWGATELRRRALDLDALTADDGAPPAAQGEPEHGGEALQESGPAAAQAGEQGVPWSAMISSLRVSTPGEDEFDVDAFVEQCAHVRPSLLAQEPEPAPGG